MNRYIIFLLVLALNVSCQKESTELHNSSVYFVKEYINYAWGYQHNGWIIDNTGEIREFNQPKHWNFADNSGFIGVNQMRKNFDSCSNILYKISSSEVNSKIYDARQSLSGKTTDPKFKMCDFGLISYSVYIYLPSERKFKRSLIYTFGDFESYNTSFAARTIYLWMQQIESRFPQN